MNRQELADRLREHAELHGALNDDEQRQWADDLRAAADIVDRCECSRELKMPDGCQCGPEARVGFKTLPSICARFVRNECKWCAMFGHKEECNWCVTCGHKENCHHGANPND